MFKCRKCVHSEKESHIEPCASCDDFDEFTTWEEWKEEVYG